MWVNILSMTSGELLAGPKVHTILTWRFAVGLFTVRSIIAFWALLFAGDKSLKSALLGKLERLDTPYSGATQPFNNY